MYPAHTLCAPQNGRAARASVHKPKNEVGIFFTAFLGANVPIDDVIKKHERETAIPLTATPGKRKKEKIYIYEIV